MLDPERATLSPGIAAQTLGNYERYTAMLAGWGIVDVDHHPYPKRGQTTGDPATVLLRELGPQLLHGTHICAHLDYRLSKVQQKKARRGIDA